MSPRRSLSGVILVALCIMVSPLAAQDSDVDEVPSLGRSLVQSNAVLTEAEREEIDDYVEYWVDQLKGAADQEVPAARVRIEQPFNDPTASKIFISSYSVTVARRLSGAIGDPDSQRVSTRINAMLIVQKIAAPGVEKLIRLGLDDKSPSVVYLTAKAVGKIGQRPELSLAQKELILRAVEDSLRQERDPLVAGQLLLSMLGLVEMEDARRALLEALDYRVTDHAKNPNIPIDADWSALGGLFLYQLRHTTQKLPLAQAQQWARATYRLYRLSVTVLHHGLADEGMDKQYRSMIRRCDNILRWLMDEQGVNKTTFPDKDKFEQARLTDRYDTLATQADQWQRLLTTRPLSIASGRLEVRFP